MGKMQKFRDLDHLIVMADCAHLVENRMRAMCGSPFLTRFLLRCTFTVIQLDDMFFKLTPTTGQPLYLQLMQQIRHAAETGALHDGDQLPGIRTLAEELVVSPNTVAKAYSELEHEGLLELRQGSGAFVCVKRRTRSLADQVQVARHRIRDLIERLREDGLLDEEIRRAFEAELLYPAEIVRKR
jgi:GntR family transcriptional regulator